MKICIITDGLVRGGAERQAVISAAVLTNLGHEVHLVTCSARNDFSEIISKHSIKIKIIKTKGPCQISRILSLCHYLRREKFEITHCFKANSSSYGRIASILAGISKIFGGYRAKMLQPSLLRLVNQLINFWTCKWIVNSEVTKDTVIKDMNVDSRSVFIVRNAVDATAVQTNLSQAAAKKKFRLKVDLPVVTILANLRDEKNHKMFLRVAKKVLESGRKAAFVIAGDGPLRYQLEHLTSDLNIQNYVYFLGQIDKPGALLRATDVLLLTSNSEGLPNCLLEAGAASVPCVATLCGGSEEIIKEGITGFLVPVDDDDLMAERVLELLTNAALRSQIGAAAKEHVTMKFSMAALGKNLITIYTGYKNKNPNHQAVQN